MIGNISPKFAICLAVFNGIKWIDEQLKTILTQYGVEVSIFVSVDSSNDGSEELVVLPHGCHFGGAAYNFFRILRDVDFSDFDYVSFSDQDDIWLPNKLLRAHEVLSGTGADAYSSNVTAFWPDGRKALIEKSQHQVQWDFLFESAGPGCTFVMRRNLACTIQNFLKTRRNQVQQVGQGQHDWFIYAFARANGYRWVIDDYAGMLYRQHENNLVGVNAGWSAFIFRVRKVLGGWGLTQSVLIAGLVGLGDDPFVIPWSNGSRVGMLRLAVHARQCRRRGRDQLLFAIACVALSIVGRRK
jgi:rhamnosyltransferase